jgi:hypothetical protein
MASIFGDDGGTLAGGRRRPTNAGYGAFNPLPYPTATGNQAVPRGTHPAPGGAGKVPGDDPPGGNGFETPPPATTTPNAPAARTYAPVLGLDLAKLQNEGHQTYKYGKEARALSSYLGAGNSIGRNNLQGLADWAKSQFGLDKSYVVGDDKVDFDGAGGMDPIDLILGNGGVWWGQEDPFTTAAAPPQGASASGIAPSGGGGVPDWLAPFITPPAPAANNGSESAAMLAALNAIAQQASAQQTDAAPQMAPTMTAPPLMFGGDGDSAALGKALQLMAMHLPGAQRAGAVNADPTLQWLMSILGMGA